MPPRDAWPALDYRRGPPNTRRVTLDPKGNAPDMDWLDQVKWAADGLVAAIAQDAASGKVLTLAWMNREALARTVDTGEAHYWSRSRRRLWRKGEESGHVQTVREVRLDCDNDALLLLVDQAGGIACHTGRERCFFQRLEHGCWVAVEPVVKDPQAIYGRR
jgi:phosphoribosyl-AMP cyclohydrolase